MCVAHACLLGVVIFVYLYVIDPISTCVGLNSELSFNVTPPTSDEDNDKVRYTHILTHSLTHSYTLKIPYNGSKV